MGRLCEQWERVLKPNGSLYVFASPRMAARVECKIGETFNVLNRITWRKGQYDTKAEMNPKEWQRLYFPVSEALVFAEHYGADNIAKGEAGYVAKCDDLRGFVFEPLRAYLDGERQRAGVSKPQVDVEWRQWKNSPRGGMSSHWFSVSQWALPTRDNYEWLRETFSRLNHGGENLRRDYEDLRRDYEDLRRDYEDLRRPFQVSADVPYTDVWDFPTVKAYPGKHPAEKPLAMMEHIVKASSRPGAVVLDCFAGSGTTGVAASRLGRDFIGIELDAGWCERARERIGTTQPALLEAL
jgi:site-specific DNA-methyltransferase (adenine-specific)